jgi:hypothetical protein
MDVLEVRQRREKPLQLLPTKACFELRPSVIVAFHNSLLSPSFPFPRFYTSILFVFSFTFFFVIHLNGRFGPLFFLSLHTPFRLAGGLHACNIALDMYEKTFQMTL